jgi:DNA-binding response OmpR family regulator
MFKILLIEDTEESKNLVCHALGSGFSVNWVNSLQKAHQAIHQDLYHLILLDVGLPDGDGFNFFSQIRHDFKMTPVIFLTARNQVNDRVLGISLGAEDYIVKPFDPAEFKARVEMRIKKTLEMEEKAQNIKKDDLEIHLTEQKVFINKVDIEATPIEFKLLVHLIKNEGHVFARDDLIKQIWGTQTHITARSIDTHVYSLRKKLGPYSDWVKSIYGQGYSLNHKKLHKPAA